MPVDGEEKQDIDIFIDKLKRYIDKAIEAKISQNQDIEDILNTNIYGFRSLGVYQNGVHGSKDANSTYRVGESGGSPSAS